MNDDFLLDVINEFYAEKNFQEAISLLLNKLCKEYEFDKVTSFLNERANKEFVWRHTCIANKTKTAYTNINNVEAGINIEEYTIRMSKSNFRREKMLYNLFEDNNIMHTYNVDEISEKLYMLNFEYSDNEIEELFIYTVIDDKNVVAYFAFEKHDKNYALKEDLAKMKAVLNILSSKIIDSEKLKEKNKRYEIKKALSETSLLDRYLLIVEKDSFNILYYEDSGDWTDGMLEKDGVNKKCYEVFADLNMPCINCPIINNEINKSTYTIRDDRDYFVRVSDMNWKNEKDSYVVSTVDATKAIVNKLSHDILTDSLTWFGFRETIKEECSRETKHVYISIDIEGMKIINDNHTQIVGNEILKQISIALKYFVKENEYFCRVVADTYAILINYIDEKNLEKRIEDLDIILSRMFRSIFSEITIIVTGGIYIIENDLINNIDIGFENTRLARNTVKGSYKNTFVFYNESMREQLKDNKFIEDKIETAIINDEFLAYIQPKFNLETWEVIGAEALVRWQSSENMIFPDKFIPVFENDGFIETLDFIVYEKIFIFIKECLDEGIDIVPISINASRSHLQNGKFIEKILLLFETYQIPKEYIEVEITESASEGSDEKLNEFVRQLKCENIAVSMDDFGSAYSSLNLLKTLQIDTLKLDKAFLGKVEKEKFTDLYSKDEIIIKNIVNMANELGFKVLCEGVETQEQVEFLKGIGCNYGQGYVFSRPIPLAEFKEKFL